MRSSQKSRIICLLLCFLFAGGCAAGSSLNRSSESSPPVQDVSIVQRISFVEEENYTRIRIEATGAITPPFYQLLSNPFRIVIDVPDINLKEIKEPVEIHNGTIGKISTTQYDDKGRIEIGLDQVTNYNISKEGNHLVIDIEKVKRVAETKPVEKKEDTVKGKGGETPPVETVLPEPSPPELKKTETPAIQPTLPPPVETVKMAKEIVDVLLEQNKDFITFNIVADGKLGNFDSMELDSPSRLVLDIWEVGTRYPQRSIKIQNPFVKEVRIGLHPDKLRLVFHPLKSQLPPYHINRINDKLIVSLGNVPQPSSPQILMEGRGTEDASPQLRETSVTSQAKISRASEGSTKTVKTSTMTEIDFKQMDDKSRVLVAFTEEPSFEAKIISKKEISVDVKNAFAPKRLQRGLDTSQFESAVSFISIENVKMGKSSDVRVLIKLKEEVPFETSKEGKILFIDVDRPKKVEVKTEPRPAPRKSEVAGEAKGMEIGKEGEKPQSELKKAEKGLPPSEEKPPLQVQVVKKPEGEKKAVGEGPPEKVYTGKKLSLDFKDADIKNILRLIAEVSNLNIIAGDDVTGKLTMRLVDVPWDQALDVILQARSLGMTRVGNVIRVAPLDTLKKEYQAELEAKKNKGAFGGFGDRAGAGELCYGKGHCPTGEERPERSRRRESG